MNNIDDSQLEEMIEIGDMINEELEIQDELKTELHKQKSIEHDKENDDASN